MATFSFRSCFSPRLVAHRYTSWLNLVLKACFEVESCICEHIRYLNSTWLFHFFFLCRQSLHYVGVLNVVFSDFLLLFLHYMIRIFSKIGKMWKEIILSVKETGNTVADLRIYRSKCYICIRTHTHTHTHIHTHTHTHIYIKVCVCVCVCVRVRAY